MPNTTDNDDTGAPMHVMQAQRIKVLQALLAQAQALVEKLTAENVALRRGINPDDPAAMAALTGPTKRKGRRPVYTAELLVSIWRTCKAGRSVEEVSEIFGADPTMMKVFMKGEYWTAAAQEAYRQVGFKRQS